MGGEAENQSLPSLWGWRPEPSRSALKALRIPGEPWIFSSHWKPKKGSDVSERSSSSSRVDELTRDTRRQESQKLSSGTWFYLGYYWEVPPTFRGVLPLQLLEPWKSNIGVSSSWWWVPANLARFTARSRVHGTLSYSRESPPILAQSHWVFHLEEAADPLTLYLFS